MRARVCERDAMPRHKVRFSIAALLCCAMLVGSAVQAAELDPTTALLRDLSNAAGPSGFEEPVRRLMVERMRPYTTSITYDGLGSVIATQGTSGPRVMLDAHMDELGGMVRRITGDGFLSMQMLGGWLDQALVDQRWVIITARGPVKAVTGLRDVHVATADERTRVFSRDSLFLDIGAKTAAEARAMGVEPGDPVVPDAPFEILNGSQNYLGKAWDDRAGCAVLLEVMRRFKTTAHPNQIFYAATTQEEVGLRGAHSAADAIKPDVGIAIEGGIAGDMPGTHPEETQAKLGAGPGIFLYDSSARPNRKMVALTKAAAAEKKIPLQLDLVQGYGDDSAEIQKSSMGVPTVNLVVPVRYTHAHNGIMNRGDFDRMVDLVVAMIQKLDGPTVAKMRDFTP
jgi:putative aminopeptidase FrvX